MYVLVVEDEGKVAAQLQKGLAEVSMVSDLATNGLDAVALARKKDYDMILLDLMITGIDGFEVVKQLRGNGIQTPIIILTARDSVQDRITGLQLGADDYLVKPFSFAELLARLVALARRGGQITQQDVVRLADLEVNFVGRRVTRGGKILDLTAKEFALLSLLVRRRGEVLSRPMIAERIWNLSFDTSLKIVDVKVGQLRVKVDEPFEKKLIHTVRGMGYVLEEREE